MACRVALLKLDRRGVIRLPVLQASPPPKSKHVKYEGEIEGESNPIQCGLDELGTIEIVRIGSADSKVSRIWNALFDKYHYLKSGPLCGAQLRYLIRSEHFGWLGGFSFSSGAWRVGSRDLWIGWDESARKKNLPKVVGNSRFLIIPHVEVPNLASHVMSLMIKRLSVDWQERYCVEPVLLETFVERGRFIGTCYKASNWIHVGETRGRGRQDKLNLYSVPVKDMYLYPLRSDTKDILCEGLPKPVVIRAKGEEDWAQAEMGSAVFGDSRLAQRLVTITRDFFARPRANIPQACQSRVKTKAAYRFFEHMDTTMDKIMQPHYESTLGRMVKEKVVLAVQDTTSLNYSLHPATENLGLIGSSEEGPIGLMVHDTVAFNLEGTPLGLLDVQCWARDPEEFGKRELRRTLPIEKKESYKWLKSFKAVAEAQKRNPDTRIVSVGDREADIHEFFELALSNPEHPQVLVRAEYDRLLTDNQGHVWDHVAEQPLSGTQEIYVPRRKNQKARTAQMEVRFAQVTLKPPKSKPHLKALIIWTILAEENNSIEGIEPLKWMLLTTRPVNCFEDAIEMLSWYCLRWGIEVYHRTLKSGCQIEQRQLGCADRIEACLAVDMVVAWRIFHLTKLGREVPDVPCTIFFEEAEWKALVAYKTQSPIPPEKTPTLREAIHMTASLGGFLGRKGDGEPGTQTLWLGLQRLEDIAATWKIMVSLPVPYHGSPPVSSPPRYG